MSSDSNKFIRFNVKANDNEVYTQVVSANKLVGVQPKAVSGTNYYNVNTFNLLFSDNTVAHITISTTLGGTDSGTAAAGIPQLIRFGNIFMDAAIKAMSNRYTDNVVDIDMAVNHEFTNVDIIDFSLSSSF